MKLGSKKLWIGAAALTLTAAVGAGVWFGLRGSSEPVNVFPFRYIGMTEYWGDNQESYGPVSTDRIQTVYVTDTQIVTQIHVELGARVKKGDLLLSFDTTLTDLALERKRLDVEKLKLQLQDGEKRLREIRAMKPMVIPQFTPSDPEEDSAKGELWSQDKALSTSLEYDGSTKDKALIYWLNSTASIDDGVLEAMRAGAELYQNENAKQAAAVVPDPASAGEPAPAGEPDPAAADPAPDPASPITEPEGGETAGPTNPPYTPFEVHEYYGIIKVTSGNMSLGDRQTWQGIHVWGSLSQGFRFQLFDAYGIPDHTLSAIDEDAADTNRPEIDYGSGYTSAQLTQMRLEQEEKNKELKFSIKMAETDYQIMKTEVSDGNVYAEIDGEVVSLLSEEEAKQNRQPIVKVSGGGGFFVEGSVSELEKDNLVLGQEVTINDWNTGMSYTGKITAIGEFPQTGSGWNGMGNPWASYYPFTAFVDESADLQAGSYASIQFSAAGTEHGIYLENPFIRTEKGTSYVYLRGANGRLEKRPVVVGKSLWGSYKEILSGITAEDMIAFPYGKTVKEGATTVESDLSVLYE